MKTDTCIYGGVVERLATREELEAWLRKLEVGVSVVTRLLPGGESPCVRELYERDIAAARSLATAVIHAAALRGEA